MRIYPKSIAGHIYYYAQRSCREKLDPTARGKTKGSGKSSVHSEMIYLGSAERIVAALTETRTPVEVRHREFGMMAAAYQTATELGLVDVLKRHIEGERFGLPRWLYFLLPILNRLSRATSKARMGHWAVGTVLPTLLGFDAKRLNSQTFWYVTDDVISERELKERRKEHPNLEDALFVGLDDATFRTMEEAVLRDFSAIILWMATSSCMTPRTSSRTLNRRSVRNSLGPVTTRTAIITCARWVLRCAWTRPGACLCSTACTAATARTPKRSARSWAN